MNNNKSRILPLATVIIPVCGLMAGCACEDKADNKVAKQPNIILIMADDLGWTDVGYISGYYNTPNLDKLKSQGVYFSNGYASASNSAPSRASMLTGRFNPHHGVYTVNPPTRGKSKDRRVIPSENRSDIKDGLQILPEALKAVGYQTAHIGKWHITANPLLKGIDINIGGNKSGHPKSYFAPYKNLNLTDGEDGEYLTDRLGDEAVNYIETSSKSDTPFFLYFAPYAVHTPLQAKAEVIAKYTKRDDANGHFNPIYAAMVESLDANVGKVLAAAEKLDNTIIIFTSDNGGLYHVSRQWPLRAGKGSFYEGGIRVPFIIYQDGKFEGGTTVDLPVSNLDIYPTLLALSGGDASSVELDGMNLIPVLESQNRDTLAERSLFWHFPAYLEKGNEQSKDPIFRSRPVSVIRKGDWKLIENLEFGDLELYNIKDDISEKNDLVDIEPEKVLELYKELQEWQKEHNAAMPTELNPEYIG